jgi:hypothetical protein
VAIRPGVVETIGGDEVVWDLPEAEKIRIREAVRARTSPRVQQPSSSSGNIAPVSTPVVPERLVRAVAAHKALATQVAKLMAKRAEIERWDGPAQEKFRRAFGTTDNQVRLRVLQQIDRQIQEASRLMASLADTIRFEFYVSQKNQ